MKSRFTGLVEREKGDNSEHNLPAMQSVGFETGIKFCYREQRSSYLLRERTKHTSTNTK